MRVERNPQIGSKDDIFKFGLKKKYSDSQVDKNVINFLFPVTLPLAKSGEKKKEEEEEEEEEAER